MYSSTKGCPFDLKVRRDLIHKLSDCISFPLIFVNVDIIVARIIVAVESCLNNAVPSVCLYLYDSMSFLHISNV